MGSSTLLEGELPEGWESCLMEDISDIVAGGTPTANDPSNFSTPEKGIPWITPADLSDFRGVYIKGGNRFLSLKGLKESSAKLLPKNSVLFTSRAPIGYVAIAENEISTNQGFKNFICKKGINPKLVFYYLKFAKDDIEAMGSGTTFMEISGSKAKIIPIVIPPLPEQSRIVEKLDQILPRVEACKSHLEKIPLTLKRFRLAVLNAACTGLLTSEWRENHKCESVGDSVSKYREQRKSSFIQNKKKYFDPVEIDLGDKTKGIEELFEIPETWDWVSLDSVIWDIKDGPHFSPKYVSKENGIAFISGRNVSYSGIDFSDAKYISKIDFEAFSKRCSPQNGDVLITKGGTTGISMVVNTKTEFNIWVHVACMKLVKEIILPEYLRDVLTTSFVYRQSKEQTHGVGNQDLGLTRMIYFAMPLPPLEEQAEIVRRIEALFDLADSLEAQYLKAKAKVDKLTQSVLAKAFRGELVPQDPSDKPASKLLDRIKLQKEPSSDPPKKLKRKLKKVKV